MNPENQDLLKSMEHSMRTNTKLLKWLLACKIIFIVVLIFLYYQLPAMLNRIEVEMQCNEIVVEDELVGFTIKPYTPICTIGFEIND